VLTESAAVSPTHLSTYTVRRYDTGNGVIDYTEFQSIVSNNLTTDTGDVKETFCVFDRHESGCIGDDDISVMFSRLGHGLDHDYVEAVAEAADVDRDGNITFTGRRRSLLSDALDTNENTSNSRHRTVFTARRYA